MAQPKYNQPDARQLVRRVSVCPLPDDETSNASLALSYTGTQLDYIEATLNGDTWRKTLTWTDGNMVAVSAWVLQ